MITNQKTNKLSNMAINFISNDIPMFSSEDIIYSDYNKLLEWFKTKTIVGIDTETEGIFNFKNRIIMLQIGDFKDQFVIDVRNCTKSELDIIKQILTNKTVKKLFWNAKFDTKFFKYCYNIDIDNIEDGFLNECILTNGLRDRKLGLSHAVKNYCNHELNKDIRGQFCKNKGLPFTTSEIIYGAEDVKYLISVCDKQREKLVLLDLVGFSELENKAVSCFMEMEYNGWNFNRDKWLEQAVKAKSNLVELEKELDNLVIQTPELISFRKKYLQTDLFSTILEREINIKWSSPTQVKKVFIKLGIEDIESTSEKDIAKYQNKYPLIKKFIDYKKEQKITTTYGEDFVKHIWPDGRIRTSFWQILETARVSSGMKSRKTREEYPNLQNIPAKNEFLNCFMASPNHKIIGIDYAAQEARIAAFGSKEPVWLNTFLSGKDLHSEVCKMMFGITDDLVRTKPEFLRGKTYRDVAKTINFGVLFGMSKFKLSNTLQISIEDADDLIKKYFSATSTLKSYLRKCSDYGLNKGYIRSYKPISGIRYFPEWRADLDSKNDFKTIGEIERACYNTPIQMTAALITKSALVKIRRDIITNNRPVKLLHAVHDAIYTETIEEYADEYAVIQDGLMKDAWNEFIPTLPIETDITITNYWTK